MDQRALKLLRLMTTAVGRQPLPDVSSGRAFYLQLRADLIQAGATDEDMQGLLVEHLVRHIVESSGLVFEEAKQAQIDLVAQYFVVGQLDVRVERGRLVDVTFAESDA
jgi:hypothetical protein